jgi:general stress protein YciG
VCVPFSHAKNNLPSHAFDSNERSLSQATNAESAVWHVPCSLTQLQPFLQLRSNGCTTTHFYEVATMNDRDNAKARGRGFASMDQEKQRSIASLGGRAAHQQGTAHEFSSEEAREAGRKGGEAVSANRAHMAAIGRKGGEASHRGSAAARAAAQSSQPAAPRVPSSRELEAGREQQMTGQA